MIISLFYIVPTTRQELFEAYKNSVKKMREVGVESGNKSSSGKKKYVGVSIGYNHRVTIAYNSKVLIFDVPARDRFPTIVGCGSRYGYYIMYMLYYTPSCVVHIFAPYHQKGCYNGFISMCQVSKTAEKLNWRLSLSLKKLPPCIISAPMNMA